NSFIIFANGEYLTGDTGYAGIPMTQHHNTLLFAGKGQAKEGSGHDAFDDVSYERLDRIRIVDVSVQKNVVRVVGDATMAYEPEVGVRKFVRTIEYAPAEGFRIRDEVETNKPTIITSLIHADGGIDKKANNQFMISAGAARLFIEPLEPNDLIGSIDVNVLTAPGPPGAVDKGERQERGYLLRLSTKDAVTSTRFVISLKVAQRNGLRSSLR
ncbi:MAG TPA: heparinase II/III family protein, partial [Pyrinomonadaceae bacterium]|nr:heparinase II/III family protein [Pyrinomonadaceae bacterium]